MVWELCVTDGVLSFLLCIIKHSHILHKALYNYPQDEVNDCSVNPLSLIFGAQVSAELELKRKDCFYRQQMSVPAGLESGRCAYSHAEVFGFAIVGPPTEGDSGVRQSICLQRFLVLLSTDLVCAIQSSATVYLVSLVHSRKCVDLENRLWR